MEPLDLVNALSAVVSAVAAVVSAAVSVTSSTGGQRRPAETHRSGREEGMPPRTVPPGRKLTAPGVRRLAPA